MTTIRKQAARASFASHRRSAAKARLRVALSIDTGELPSVKILASHGQAYRPHVVKAMQDLNVLQAQYARDSK
ncbi:hypothetical protein C8K18_1074 [Paraburkholderia sp. GV068]|uniref:hypothetical protein n=1 Tax=unclassified Paraburkholderia TaxID=2615204 RepID=UPI000D30F8DF|nr:MULTISPECIES: hypothetical protein [unclassified Paraburkholderia]PTQ98422.1 hypothetical protein C8K19_1074 [Paraburkholderia sp. GV072]PUB03665.1 hypothetical protein C8K18_1074 [Paraburkholderia sp. GV068]